MYLEKTGGGGFTGGTPSCTLSGYESVTNASSIYELNGMGYQIGGSAIIPVKTALLAVGGDLNIIPNSDSDKVYFGKTMSCGIGIGKPGGEFHIEWGKTVTIPKTEFNVFDMFDSVYTKIMEW